MAHKKGGGSAKNLSKNNPAYRGVKKFDGEFVISGNILIRQCGTRIHPGIGVGLGRDYTIFATTPGFVKYENRPGGRKTVSVYPTHPNRPGLEVRVIEVAEDDEAADSIEVGAN